MNTTLTRYGRGIRLVASLAIGVVVLSACERPPPTVVMSSLARLPRSLIRVPGKSSLYHLLSMIVRVRLECSRAKS